jgi:uncharacterized protein YcbX
VADVTQSDVGAVFELWRHPVKSIGGERLNVAQLNERGVIGDRLWAVHTADGKFGSGKNTRRFRRIDGLLALAGRLEGTEPVVTLPDGTELHGTGPATDAALALALDTPHIGLRREGEVCHLDAKAIHLITTSGLRWLRSALPDAQVDPRRFRPNIVIDTEGSDRVEETWIGRELMIGPVRLRVTGPTGRCVMTTAQQPGIDHDARILKTLTEQTTMMFGVYADIVAPGTITLGDRVLLG